MTVRTRIRNVILGAAAAAAGVILIVISRPTPIPPTGTANMWIAATGSSSCSRSSSAIDYSTANSTGHVCDTINRAYQAAASSGDTVLVKCGIYGPQSITAKATATGMTTIRSETGTCATFDSGGGSVSTGSSLATCSSPNPCTAGTLPTLSVNHVNMGACSSYASCDFSYYVPSGLTGTAPAVFVAGGGGNCNTPGGLNWRDPSQTPADTGWPPVADTHKYIGIALVCKGSGTVWDHSEDQNPGSDGVDTDYVAAVESYVCSHTFGGVTPDCPGVTTPTGRLYFTGGSSGGHMARAVMCSTATASLFRAVSIVSASAYEITGDGVNGTVGTCFSQAYKNLFVQYMGGTSTSDPYLTSPAQFLGFVKTVAWTASYFGCGTTPADTPGTINGHSYTVSNYTNCGYGSTSDSKRQFQDVFVNCSAHSYPNIDGGSCASTPGWMAGNAASFFDGTTTGTAVTPTPAIKFTGSASWLKFENLTIKTCAVGCTVAQTGVFDCTCGTSNITFDGNQFNVGTVNEGGALIWGYKPQNWTIINNTFGPTCCGLGTNQSPVGISFGKPSTGTNDCAHEACGLKVNNNLFQYADLRKSTDWPTSGWGSAPTTGCTNFTTCHLDGVHVFGCIGCEFNYNQFLGTDCEGIYIEGGGGQGNDNRDIDIIGNAATAFSDHCNGHIYIKCSVTNCGGTYNIGFNEGPDLLNISTGATNWAGAEPGTIFNIYGNYSPLEIATNGNNAGCLAGTTGNATVNYRYNAWRSYGAGGNTPGPCDVTDTTGNTPAWVNSSGSPTVGLDMHKTGSLGVADNFVPCASLSIATCPTLDLFGTPLGATADAGAVQR